MAVVDSKDNLQDPNVRTESISGTNLFGFKDKFESRDQDDMIKELVQGGKAFGDVNSNKMASSEMSPNKY